MALNENNDKFESYYHCSVEWHLWQLKTRKGIKTPFATVLYAFAYHLSKDSGVFYASAVRIAEHFNTSVWSVIRAMDALTIAGFFCVISKENFRSTMYRVVSHVDWAEAHPGQCVKKAALSKSGMKKDELGVRLHAKCGGRTKWYPYDLAALRQTNLDDNEIVNSFDMFVAQQIHGRQAGEWESVPSKFRDYLSREVSDLGFKGLEVKSA